MPLSVNPQVELIHTNDTIFIVDVTGDYNAVTNPNGWGSPNEARSALTAITALVTYPDATTDNLTLTSTDFDNDSVRAYNATTLKRMDGVYEIDVTFTVSANNEVVTEYSLRDNAVKCQLAALALGDLEINDYAEAKSIYDKMHTVFECDEYVLTEEVLDDLEAFFDDCGYTKIRCGCGC
jgi:hypothetical protein